MTIDRVIRSKTRLVRTYMALARTYRDTSDPRDHYVRLARLINREIVGLRMRARVTYCFPVWYKRREIDSIVVRAPSIAEAKRNARYSYNDRGYTTAGGYRLGTPNNPDAR